MSDSSQAPRYAPNELDSYWMPFTANRAFAARPRMLVSAKDMHYRTDDGRELLDAMAGMWCCNAGHCRDPIVEAIRAQAGVMDYATAFQIGHPRAFELAARLALMAPGDLDHVFFVNSGSEAVDTALKMALGYHARTGEGTRTRLIGRARAYHGAGFGGVSVGGVVANRKNLGPLLPGTDHLPATYDRSHQAFSRGEPEWGGHLADALVDLIALHDVSTIAAVIVEPVAGAPGVFAPPKGYLERLRQITADYGILLIFDEVITAFGRLGHAFAAERYGVVPDMICFAKGVTSGTVPMGGVLARSQIYDTYMRGPQHVPEFAHGYTYSGHPLAVAAAHATLDLYAQEGLFARAGSLEETWAVAIHALRNKPVVADIRTIGLCAGIDLLPHDEAPGLRGAQALDAAFFEAGLVCRVAGDTIELSPPLIITEAEIGEVADRLARVLDAVV